VSDSRRARFSKPARPSVRCVFNRRARCHAGKTVSKKVRLLSLDLPKLQKRSWTLKKTSPSTTAKTIFLWKSDSRPVIELKVDRSKKNVKTGSQTHLPPRRKMV